MTRMSIRPYCSTAVSMIFELPANVETSLPSAQASPPAHDLGHDLVGERGLAVAGQIVDHDLDALLRKRESDPAPDATAATSDHRNPFGESVHDASFRRGTRSGSGGGLPDPETFFLSPFPALFVSRPSLLGPRSGIRTG